MREATEEVNLGGPPERWIENFTGREIIRAFQSDRHVRTTWVYFKVTTNQDNNIIYNPCLPISHIS